MHLSRYGPGRLHCKEKICFQCYKKEPRLSRSSFFVDICKFLAYNIFIGYYRITTGNLSSQNSIPDPPGCYFFIYLSTQTLEKLYLCFVMLKEVDQRACSLAVK